MNAPLEQQVLFEVDKICATLNENDLTDVVRNSPYELELCQTEDDTLDVLESRSPPFQTRALPCK